MPDILDMVVVNKQANYEQLITRLEEDHNVRVIDKYDSKYKLAEVIDKEESTAILLDSKMFEKILREELNNLLMKIEHEKKGGYIKRLMVKSSDRYYFLKAENIDWIESSGNYVRIHSESKEYLIRDTMKNMERKLNPEQFYRIHRTAIVNINSIKSMEKWFSGDYKVFMKNDDELMMSRNYTSLIEQF